MTVLRGFLVAIIAALLQACSGIMVSQDYVQDFDFTGLRNFAWLPQRDQAYGVRDNDILDRRIRGAIERTLVAKGYRHEQAAAPDFYVSYHLTVEQKISSRPVTGTIAIGRGGYGGYGGIGIQTGTEVRTYDEGTLLIDFTAPGDGRLVWRGISTREVSKHTDPEESKAVIDETVEKVLQQFPPEKKAS